MKRVQKQLKTFETITTTWILICSLCVCGVPEIGQRIFQSKEVFVLGELSSGNTTSSSTETMPQNFDRLSRPHLKLPLFLPHSAENNHPSMESYFMTGVSIFGRQMFNPYFDISTGDVSGVILQVQKNYSVMNR